MMRKGLGKGKGSGYYNILKSHDHKVHKDAGFGRKQPQRMPFMPNQPDYQTKCMSCGTRYAKNRFLFDSCPVCRGRNLKEIKRGGKQYKIWVTPDGKTKAIPTIKIFNNKKEADTWANIETAAGMGEKYEVRSGKVPFNKIKKLSETDPLPFDKKNIKINPYWHLPIETAVIIPSTKDVDKKLSKKQFKSRVKQSEKELAKLLDGYTKVDTVGGFWDEGKKKIVKEKGAKITIFATRQKMQQKSEEYKKWILAKQKEWGQSSIGFEAEGDMYYLSSAK